MLEWTWAYYKGEDVDLYMYYRMHYAPLFKSLLHHFPLYGESFFKDQKHHLCQPDYTIIICVALRRFSLIQPRIWIKS